MLIGSSAAPRHLALLEDRSIIVLICNGIHIDLENRFEIAATCNRESVISILTYDRSVFFPTYEVISLIRNSNQRTCLKMIICVGSRY